MIKVFMANGEDFIFDMEDEEKEISLIYKFHGGTLSSKSDLKLTRNGRVERINIRDINNLQFVRKEPAKQTLQKSQIEEMANRFVWEFVKGGTA